MVRVWCMSTCFCTVVQAKMNSYFMGSQVVLAERYASLLKTMFVCLFYSAIFPQGYFVASMAMFMTYWVRIEMAASVADVLFMLQPVPSL